MSGDLERLALAILNSDRAMAGFPAAASREGIPVSDGYVVNARAVLNELRAMHADPVLHGYIDAMLEDAGHAH